MMGMGMRCYNPMRNSPLTSLTTTFVPLGSPCGYKRRSPGSPQGRGQHFTVCPLLLILALGMATGKLSADSISGHPYPRLISDIRTRTRYLLWITNSIHIRYPRVTDIRGYIHLPTTHTTYLNPANSNMISYLSSKFKYDKNIQPYRICPANEI
jgi:hypothetical protein